MKSKGVQSIEAKWYLIRDLYFGFNYKKQDISRALQLAAEIADKHAEAKWLVEHAPVTVVDENCPLSLCFSFPITYEKWRRAASVFGYPLAVKCFSSINIYTVDSHEFKLIESVALKGERDAFKALGICCITGMVCCEQNTEKAKEWWLRGAKLGHVDCMEKYASEFSSWSDIRCKWTCKIAMSGLSFRFLHYFSSVMQELRPTLWFCI